MKILLVNSLYYPNSMGGAEKSTQILAEGLIKRDFKVVVVCIHPYKDEVVFHNEVKVYYLYHRNVYFKFKKKNIVNQMTNPLNFLIDMYNPFIGRTIGKILETERPDIVHTNNIYGISPIIWKVAKEFNIPLIHTLHDLQLICARGVMFKKHSLCRKRCSECEILTLPRKWLSKNIDGVVGVSKFILEKHTQLGLFNNISKKVIIPNPLMSDPIPLPKRYVNNPIKFLYLGGEFEHKGFYLLMNVFSKLQKEANRWELLIAGRGVYKEKLPKNIKVLGFINPKDIYPKVDVVTAPSLCNEAFSRIVIEANAYGLPVIGSKRGGIPEIILHKKTGFIFDPDDKDEFLKYIKLFIDNPDLVLRLSLNCLRHSKNFKIDKILDAYIKLYTASCAPNP